MRTTILQTILFSICALFFSSAMAQISQAIVWQQTIGGADTDSLTAMTASTNGTFVMCGASKSKKGGNKTDGNAGGFDYWIVKMNESGAIIWNKTFGGKKNDIATAIITTSDGGYLVGGSSLSDKSAIKSSVSYKKSNDYWVLKLDANGNRIWDKTLGGFYTDKLTSLTELPGGKYVAGGYSFSDKGGVKTSDDIGLPNTSDYWVVYLRSNDGAVLSQSLFGGTSADILTNLAPGPNGTVYTAGYSYSLKYSGFKTQLPAGNNDFWILRSDTSGIVQSELGFGGNRSDFLTSMQVLPDNSLVLGGYSNSPVSGTKAEGFLGVTDYWVVKTNPDGTKQWDKTIGGKGGDYLMSVQQTKDKGFILGGYSNSNTGNSKSADSKGGNDYWIVKLDSLGNKIWDRTIGGSGDDKLSGIYEIDTNQFIVAGTSNSPISGDKTSKTIGNLGAADFWVLRLSADGNRNKIATQSPVASLPAPASFTIAPNPVTTTLTINYKTGDHRIVNFVVYAANGNAVLKAALPGAAGTHRFDATNLSKGIYYAVMYIGDKKVTQVFVKE